MAPYFLWPWHFITFVVCLFVGITIVLASDSSSVCQPLRNNEVEVVVIGPYNKGLLLIGNDGRALEVEKKLENNKLTLKEKSATTAKNLLYGIELNFDLSAGKYFLFKRKLAYYLGHVSFGQKEAKLSIHQLRQSITKPVNLKELLDPNLNSRNQLIISGQDQALMMKTDCGPGKRNFCQAGSISVVETGEKPPIKPFLTWEKSKCEKDCIRNVTLEARSALYLGTPYMKLYIFGGNIVWLLTSKTGKFEQKNLSRLLVCYDKPALGETQLICLIIIVVLLLIAMGVLWYQCNLQTPLAHNVRLPSLQRKTVHLSDSVSEDSEQLEEWKKKREKRKREKKKEKPQKNKKKKKVVRRKKKKEKKKDKKDKKEENDQASLRNPTFTKSSADTGRSIFKIKSPQIQQSVDHNQRQAPSFVALDPNSAEQGRTNLSPLWKIFGNGLVGNGLTNAPLHSPQTASSTVADIDSNEFVSAQEMLSE